MIFKRLYDWLATTLFVGVLVLGVSSLGLQFLAQSAASFTGDGETTLLWQRISVLFDVDTLSVRLVVFGVAQAGVIGLFWQPLRWLWRWVDHGLDRLDAPKSRWPRASAVAGRVFSFTITLVLLPLLLQPTLVPWSVRGEAWLERAANVLDGQASSAAAASVVSVWRWAFPPPLHNRHAGGQSRMDRWDPLLKTSTTGPEHFAQTKAFMYVESAGRQYAVSQTGCAGLMQFCVTTAQRSPFRQIFGVGTVTACNCGGQPCSVPRAIAEDLETDPDALDRHQGALPCDPADARFDPERAIPAGAAYTAELSEQVGGNLALMYIGYNSGPAVAKQLWLRTGKNPDVTLTQLRPHLAPTLARWYGDRATSRANGLLDTHLPKLLEAHERYLE